ncbi:hypothetical protein ElyMa_005175100 [Elysia marginata]|uniref:CTNNB1 binding N-teminal domain-containing protein n=1 Tax=Elysia marginata TaxID=1093978 RepID=A0AAV4JSZ7_9GAST|nr:hypothetical protein ElyMa_005175100 [Elysia marginata]
MAMAAEQHPSWFAHAADPAARMVGGGGFDPSAGPGGMLPSEDISDMFFPHALDSQTSGHMGGGYYSAGSAAARAVHGYRSAHGKSPNVHSCSCTARCQCH